MCRESSSETVFYRENYAFVTFKTIYPCSGAVLSRAGSLQTLFMLTVTYTAVISIVTIIIRNRFPVVVISLTLVFFFILTPITFAPYGE